MKNTSTALISIALIAGSVLSGMPTTAVAQTAAATFPDVSANHWAYQSVQDLAAKGFVKGYPDGKFLGNRAMTRFEFATVLDRVLQTLSDMQSSHPATTDTPLQTPTGQQVTQDDLNKIQVLVDTFHDQLVAIQSNVTSAEDEIEALRQDVQDAKTLANKAQATADNSYGVGTRKFSINGLIQARGTLADSGSHARFPQGTAAAGAYNGNYAQGSSADSADVRRARIIMLGKPTDNTTYKIQLDAAGPINAGTNSANQQISVLEAWGSYAFGKGANAANSPTITAGEFANPFGVILPASPTLWLTPERPLAFSNTNNVGLWDSQDYDKGVKLSYTPGPFSLVYSLVNGAGRQSEDMDNHFDSDARIGYTFPGKIAVLGVSYYDGFVDRARPTGIPAADVNYPAPKKQLLGLDAAVNLNNGIFLSGEYIKGTYEKRAYFDENLATAANPIGADSLIVDNYVKGNQVQGYYLWGGYTLHKSSSRPLTIGVDYDVFQRSINPQDNSADALQGNAVGGGTFYGGGEDDVNVGYGVMYNLDKATRLRLWYDEPLEVAHVPGTPAPPNIGLTSVEMMVVW